jgi:hypothetical protein
MVKAQQRLEDPKIGEMPQLHYLTEMGNTSLDSDGSSIRWIGMRTYAPDRQVKDFLWWNNFDLQGDLRDEKARYHAASFITRLKVEHQTDAAIGLPVDLVNCNEARNHIALVNKPNLYGVYIETPKRQMFNFMLMGVSGLKSEAQLRRSSPTEFDQIFQQAREVLPYDKR